MFSDKEIASYINANFEPAWQSVRPVPIITVDMGNGNVVRKTFRGNIGTYVCTTDGDVFDILPGLYSPAQYLQQLHQLHDQVVALPAGEQRLSKLIAYHLRRRGIAPTEPDPSANLVDAMDGMLEANRTERHNDALDLDTAVNQTARRELIHEKLATAGLTTPDSVKHWLYKNVLHADIDDPYLGTRELFVGNN